MPPSPTSPSSSSHSNSSARGVEPALSSFFHPHGEPLGTPGQPPSVTEPLSPDHFRRVDLQAAFSVAPPPVDFVLPGLVAGTVGALVSAGGSGKSLLALQLCAAVASGRETAALGWVPDMSTGQPAVYFPAEDPDGALLQRIHGLGQFLPPDARDRVAANLDVYSVLGAPDVLSQRWLTAICRLCEGRRLVVFDTLRRFHLADENSSSDMARVVAALEQVAASSGAAVVYLHHTTKASALGGLGGEQQASRGSSVLVDNVRWQAFLVGMSPSEAASLGVSEDRRRAFVRLGLSKCNYCAAPADVWLSRGEGGFLFRANPSGSDESDQGRPAGRPRRPRPVARV